MGRTRDSLIWGIILLIVGLLFLLWNFGVFADFESVAEWIIVGLFALIGLGFLGSYLLARQDWWKVIPGFALLAVSGVIFLSTRNVPSEWIGAMLFIGIALAFAVIYFGDREERWWAIIPFGTMVVMVVIVLLSSLAWAEAALGAVLFGGMGLVFLLVYLLAPDRSQFRWALIPMSVLMIMGLVALAASLVDALPNLEQALQLWPILLVVIGVFLLGVSISRRGAPAATVTELPAAPRPAEVPAAPGTAVYEMPEELPSPPPVVREPIQLFDQPAAEAEAPAPAETEPGEVTDIYEFLESAPPPAPEQDA